MQPQTIFSAEPLLQASLTSPITPRLLLAEDDEDLQTIMRLLLQKIDLDVSIASDGKMACEMAEQSKAENRPYDLIFMDIQMPRMNGYEATQWLRQHGWQGFIVALTAHAMAGDREKCLAAGCDDYLAKPVFIAGLREVLKRHLGYLQPPTRMSFRTNESIVRPHSDITTPLTVG